MRQEEVEKLTVAMGLTREVVGVRFLFLKEEYDVYVAEEPSRRSSFCGFVMQAMNGACVKVNDSMFSCPGAPELFGMRPEGNYHASGKHMENTRLYRDMAIARSVHSDLGHVDQKIYGMAIAPLRCMERADIVLFMCDTWQLMRVIQGYTYNRGTAKNLQMIGNQGICADLAARPYYNNDLNISVLCAGARIRTQATNAEMGVGLPMNLFKDLVDGIVQTINPAMNKQEKEALAARMGDKNIFGFELEYNKFYPSYDKDWPYSEDMYD